MPSSICFTISKICAVALADPSASFRISSATTANPFPASPALAASIAAFNDSRLVWPAMSETVCAIILMPAACSMKRSAASEISFDVSLLLSMACLVSAKAPRPAATAAIVSSLLLVVCFERSAFAFECSSICSMNCTACCRSSEMVWEPCAISSVDTDTCSVMSFSVWFSFVKPSANVSTSRPTSPIA